MDNEKYKRLLNNQKFDCVSFALDYIRSMRELTGEINNADFIACLEKTYSQAFRDGQRDILDRTIYTMFHEIDIIEEQENQN